MTKVNREDINKNCKIVVVDDSDFSRKVILNILESKGINTVGEASSAKEAMEIIGKTGANLIITDVVMPDKSGIELIKQFSDGFSDKYFIVVSSLSQERIIVEAITAGAMDYIKKPFKEEQLMQSLLKVAHRIIESGG